MADRVTLSIGGNMQFEWWQWLVGAVAMALLELAVPAFVLIWFALGALLVALVILILPSLR